MGRGVYESKKELKTVSLLKDGDKSTKCVQSP